MPAYSYMITNRRYPTAIIDPQSPLDGNTLWWYVATAQANDPNYEDYQSLTADAQASAPPKFVQAVVTELQNQGSATPSLTLFIHGLNTTWSYAVRDTATLGANLASMAGYDGLVIGFSWPSMGELDLIEYADSFPQPAQSGTARGNVMCSLASFGSLIAFTQQLAAQVPGLQLNVVCHSEGNYLLMNGLAANSGAGITETIMLAADINNGALQTPASGLTGSAAAIAAQSSRVTVYYSSNDNTLALSEGAFSTELSFPLSMDTGAYHNPAFFGRLGLAGPSYDQGPQASNMASVDCSAVVNQVYVGQLSPSVYPAGTVLHSAYLYIPQVIQDIAATLTGTAPGAVANRTPLLNNGQYFMSAET
ncbi:alpha/beta hydrolase [Roseateles sp. DXS20W]|uniref:Alpha/beta hydrolase n=1 Tax=Pelomonas lactea TaxID=3299030 RepID=A0ABW7GJ06_9BURK